MESMLHIFLPWQEPGERQFFLGPVTVGCGGWGKGGLRVGHAAEGVGENVSNSAVSSIPERILYIA